MYQFTYHGDPHNFDQLYDPAFWTVTVDMARVKGAVYGILLRAGIGTRKDPVFDRVLALLKSWGIPWGLYHAYDPSADPVHQAQLVRQWCPELPPLGVWGDVEMGTAISAVTQVYLAALDHEFGHPAGIYSGGPYLDAHFTAAQQDQLDERLLWIAGYPNFWPPYGWNKGQGNVLHQYTDHYVLPGLERPCDMSRLNPIYPVEKLMTSTLPPLLETLGCFFAGHTQGNSQIMEIYRDLAAAGAVPPGIISDEDAGKMLEAAAIGVPVRIFRPQQSETGVDHDFEGGGAGRLSWGPAMEDRFVYSSATIAYRRMGYDEFQATTLVQAGYNEWDAHSVEEWLKTLDVFDRVLTKIDQLGAGEIASLMGISVEKAKTLHPLRLILPIFNAGTPSKWEYYLAMAKHPIWKHMQRRGDVIGCHEGIAFGQPFTWGENQPVEPGAPQFPGAGLVNFRIDNLLALLWAQGIYLNYAILEWYDGRRWFADSIDERIDNMIRMDKLLAHAGGPWRRYCLFYATFELTNELDGKWGPQDFTKLWRHPRWQAYFISQRGRKNGGNLMPDIKQPDFDLLLLHAANRSALAQADLAILTSYKPVHIWAAGDVVLANVQKFQLFDSTHTPSGPPRENYNSRQNVLAVSDDQKWLKVFAKPEYWVRVSDIVLAP